MFFFQEASLLPPPPPAKGTSAHWGDSTCVVTRCHQNYVSQNIWGAWPVLTGLKEKPSEANYACQLYHQQTNKWNYSWDVKPIHQEIQASGSWAQPCLPPPPPPPPPPRRPVTFWRWRVWPQEYTLRTRSRRPLSAEIHSFRQVTSIGESPPGVASSALSDLSFPDAPLPQKDPKAFVSVLRQGP